MRSSRFGRRPKRWAPSRYLDEARRLDVAVYSAIARAPTPNLDVAMARLSRAADYSRLWIASAVALAVGSGERGRRAAGAGVTSLAVTAAVVNLVLKPVGRRRRPDRIARTTALARPVPMPRSAAFPSGHSATAFAFVTGVAGIFPSAAIPLWPLAAAVAYSRVHTGVHYPADAVAGSIIGASIARLNARGLRRGASGVHRRPPEYRHGRSVPQGSGRAESPTGTHHAPDPRRRH